MQTQKSMEAKQQFSEGAEGKLAILARDFSASRYTLYQIKCWVTFLLAM